MHPGGISLDGDLTPTCRALEMSRCIMGGGWMRRKQRDNADDAGEKKSAGDEMA
jgi:hypothetical protein